MRRSSVRRATLVAALTVATMLAGAGVSTASPAPQPLPPPSGSPTPPKIPTDAQLQQSKQGMTSATAKVGLLTRRLADTQAETDELGEKLEVRRELANKALVDLQSANATSVGAQARAATTHTGTVAAEAAAHDARGRVDQFVAAAYEQSLTGGSLGLLAEASDPQDLLSRAQLTESLARDQRTALEALGQALIAKVNADSMARAAQLDAHAKQRIAVGAKSSADRAVAAARAAVATGVAALKTVQVEREDIEHQLDQLTAHDAGLRAQRQRYLSYQRQITTAAKAEISTTRRTADRSLVSGAAPPVQSVIDRALSEVGVTYAWGGGNTDGATKGIHDGGEADNFGDYQKTGFDCSGLMMYAFGGAGIDLPHFSGYQYDKGNRVPIGQMRPGDLLFWAQSGTIHHVALYIGDGKMVEAPYSGGSVRVTPIRYGDGLMPYAVRML